MRNAEIEKSIEASMPKQDPWWTDVAAESMKRAPKFFAFVAFLSIADVLLRREHSMLLDLLGVF